MGYLKYKGYTGSVEYSEEDKCLFGKVQGMAKDSITYEGSTVEELTKDFEEAIDDYLALCEEKGIEPRKPYSGVLNVRLARLPRIGATSNPLLYNIKRGETATVSPLFLIPSLSLGNFSL